MLLRFLSAILLAVVCAAATPDVAEAQESMAFTTWGTAEGLSHDTVISLEIDALGYLWAGTFRGLNRHEGVRVATYLPIAGDSLSLPAARVDAIRRTSSGDIWVGMTTGFARYDPATDTFVPYRLTDSVQPIVHLIEEGPDGMLYLGTWTHGLIRFNPETGHATSLFAAPHEQLDGPTSDGLTIRHMSFMDNGLAWITSYTGVWTLDVTSGQVGRPAWPAATQSFLSGIQSMSVLELGGHTVLFASLHGLVAVDRATGTYVVHRLEDKSDGEWNYIRDIAALPDGRVVLATAGGLAMWDPKTRAATRMLPSDNKGEPLVLGSITKVKVDGAGNFWAATTQAGLLYADWASYPVPHVTQGFASNYTFPGGHVWSVAEWPRSRLWIGTPKSFGYWDTTSRTYHAVRLRGQDGTGVSAMKVLSDGTMVLATTTFGVCRFQPLTSVCTPLFDTNGTIYTIEETPDGNIWFGQFRHLYRYNLRTAQLEDFRDRLGRGPDDVRLVLALHVDPSGVLWVGMEFGLSRLDPGSDRFIAQDIAVSDLLISSIHDAPDGHLWLAGTDIHLFNPTDGHLVSRPLAPGEVRSGLRMPAIEDTEGRIWIDDGADLVSWSGNQFTGERRAPLPPVRRTFDFTTTGTTRMQDGRLVIGFQDGFHIFRPDSIPSKQDDQPVDIVSVSFQGRVHRPTQGDTVRADYDARVIHFTLASPRYAATSPDVFEVRLDGFDDGWRAARSGEVTYTNLEPGTYALQARRLDPYRRSESTLRPVTLIISSPWWARSWFIALVIGTGIALLLSIVRWRERDLSRRGDILDALVQRRTLELTEKAHELQTANDMKARFFSNISHELRTPLTLIKGYLEDAEATRADVRLQRAAGLTDRLDALVTQLLDVARSEGNRHALHREDADLVAFTHRIVTHFGLAARQNGIELTFEHDREAMWASFDAIKMDQVLSNLIGNALKFTPVGGAVWVSLAADDGKTVCLTVADSGVGIPETDLERVFDRFYQVEHELTREHEGLGIGLSLTRDFVELHGGHISALSEPESGAVFSAIFPDMLTRGGGVPSQATYHELSSIGTESESGPRRLLIVEDNDELRNILCRQLGSRFDVSAAADGREAWELIRRQSPDIVLSDVMMPGMSGLDLLREVRNSPAHANLPFILLTARTGDDAQVEGFAAEADDFIAKPYNSRILVARLENLARRGRVTPEQTSIPAPDADNDILVRLQAHVDANLTNAQLSVDDVASALFMSARTLQRHIKELTGDSAAAHVRKLRLEHARKLLESGGLASVSEAARRTGFSNVSYFSKVYEDAFGISPRAYLP